MSRPNPYAPPEDDAPPERRKRRKRGQYDARFSGESLVVSRDAELPCVCLKCGTRDDIVRRDAKFQWTPVWARFLVFCLIGAIIMLATTKRATLSVPLCARCNARWSAARSVATGGVVALVGSFLWMRFGDAQPLLGVGLLLAVVAAFVITAIIYVRPRTLQAKHIDDAEITLKGVAPAAAQEIIDGSA